MRLKTIANVTTLWQVNIKINFKQITCKNKNILKRFKITKQVYFIVK